MRVTTAFVFLAPLLAAAACCDPDPADPGSGTDAGPPRDGVTPVPLRDAGGRGCSEAAQLVYVLSDTNELYSFRPNLRQFTRVGPLRCPTTLRPNSMAIDRDAIAWVNYIDPSPMPMGPPGVIYRVDTADATCTAAQPIALPQEFRQLGMGFSTAGMGRTDEALFIVGTGASSARNSVGLGRIDPATGSLARVGAFSGDLRGYNAELTGTGDGRLFGFFITTPVQVAEIDPASAVIRSARSLPEVERPSDWAFSFWGGAFYLYTVPSSTAQPGRTSNVTRYRPSDDSVDPGYMTDIGFRIVGAGVSTCAPLAAPP